MSNRDAVNLLQWSQVLQALVDRCRTPEGVRSWRQQAFLLPEASLTEASVGLASTDSAHSAHSAEEDNPVLDLEHTLEERIEAHLADVLLLKRLLQRFGEPSFTDAMPDAAPILARVAQAAELSAEEAARCLVALTGSRLLLSFVRRHWESVVTSSEWRHPPLVFLQAVEPPVETIDFLELRLTPRGEIADTASLQLGQLRQRLKNERQTVQRLMRELLATPAVSRALQEPVIREWDGRSVLPVKVEMKASVPGIVHGSSASGATVFVEPQAVVPWNNRLQETQAELEREIRRILREIAQHLGANADGLLRFLRAVGQLDRRWAAARLSLTMQAEPVALLLEPDTALCLKQLRHPLLALRPEVAVVANDVLLGRANLPGSLHTEGKVAEEAPVRTLIVTGPNTGGKTVLLTAVGLSALMLQAGLHLPVAEGSAMSLFNPVLCDMGDAQDLQQSLSTFSGHIGRLIQFTKDETPLHQALVLIDEIAAGTDPVEGTVLARAILQELHQRGALTLVTTHLSDLKLEAHHQPGYANASMAFDLQTLAPTYRLLMGIPGASNALIIAERLGLKSSIIQRAHTWLDSPSRESAALLAELEEKSRWLEDDLLQARRLREEAEQAYIQANTERQQLRDNKRRLLQEFRSGLKSRLHDLEAQMKEARQAFQTLLQQAGDSQDPTSQPLKLQSLKLQVRQLGRAADQVFDQAGEPLLAEAQAEYQAQALTPVVGQSVFCESLHLTATVSQVLPDTQMAVIEAGLLRSTVPWADLRPVETPTVTKRSKPRTQRLVKTQALSEGPAIITQECDLRGQRVEEGLRQLEAFLDNALREGHGTVGVIHGHGTGAMKESVRQYLRELSYVKRFYPSEARFGGDGRTVVEFQ
ncbi:MAG: Smr/MutS family protein [Candidatus Melainabacteria bacterium]|nr:Smr/MutS family protein [Candidatus Melainabacteria bacterium]